MIYVVSDLHGSYDSWCNLLEMIDFSDDDEMYVLGDIIDRGPRPIDLIFDLMVRPNVYPLVGNHEYYFMLFVGELSFEANVDDYRDYVDEDKQEMWDFWLRTGGGPTIEQYLALPVEDRLEILDYIREFALFEEVSVGGVDFVLTHSGLKNFEEGKPLEEYQIKDFLFDRPDRERRFFEDKVLVCGHTPTMNLGQTPGEAIMLLEGEGENLHGFCLIDGGACWEDTEGGKLLCLRLDDLKVFAASRYK